MRSCTDLQLSPGDQNILDADSLRVNRLRFRRIQSLGQRKLWRIPRQAKSKSVILFAPDSNRIRYFEGYF